MKHNIHELTQGMPTPDEVRKQQAEAASRRRYDASLEATVLNWQHVWFRSLYRSLLFLCVAAGLTLVFFACSGANVRLVSLVAGLFTGFAVADAMTVLHYLAERKFTETEGV